jgi:hypothetical protein
MVPWGRRSMAAKEMRVRKNGATAKIAGAGELGVLHRPRDSMGVRRCGVAQKGIRSLRTGVQAATRSG